jgi:hypothetical protein
MSNAFLKDKKQKRQIITTILKVCINVLPHAKQLHERKFENIPSPMCPWYTLKEEDTHHIMIECPNYEKVREEIIEKVITT